ncbi:MAG: DUF2326 domain-containing protein [Deltaproteobacteria bacterium]|jgi:uncharacterized protein YydD (DUF2326 family)|nr:DUF2326 domain-containing protein [Deltaproteobacteria bacterium]
MKLSKLYSNSPHIFKPIVFNDGVNVIMAEHMLLENLNKNNKNLKKSFLGFILDFTLLSNKDINLFLSKNYKIFDPLVFFLEIKVDNANYITIKRSVAEPSKICFKTRPTPLQDFSDPPLEDWDRQDLSLDQAIEELNGLLDFQSARPWNYRAALFNSIHARRDIHDIFKKSLKLHSKHINSIPLQACLLGFNAYLILKLYEKEDKLQELLIKENELREKVQLFLYNLGYTDIEGLLLLKSDEVARQQKLLDAFDFSEPDYERTINLADNIDVRIAELNNERYSLNFNLNKIKSSLESGQILFSPEKAKLLFEEAGVLFAGQIKKDFETLIAFNRAITEERQKYLQVEFAEIKTKLQNIDTELIILNKKRSDILSFITEKDSFKKYKKLSNELVTLRSDLAILDEKRIHIRGLADLRKEIKIIKAEINALKESVNDDIYIHKSNNTSIYSQIRLYFSEIIENVLSRKAILSVLINKAGHLKFRGSMLNESGSSIVPTNRSPYRKLFRVAFDLAVLRSRIHEKFPRFVFYDGVFESLNPQKKEKLLLEFGRQADLGLQPIIINLDSDSASQSDAAL